MALGLVSFACMGVIHKLGDRLGKHPVSFTLVAMAAGSAFSFLYAAFFQHSAIETVPRIVVLLALPFGASAALELWFSQQALRHGHIVTSWLMINLSAGRPTALSIMFYREPLPAKKFLVFLLVIAALILLWWDRRRQVGESR